MVPMNKKHPYLIILLLITSCSYTSPGYEIKNGKVHYTYNTGSAFSRGTTVEEADAATFKKLNIAYGVDKKQAYYNGEPIPNSDPESFTHIYGVYSKDNSQVYFRNKPIDGADSKTFEVLPNSFSKDHKDYYIGTTRLHITNLESFRDLTVIRKNKGSISLAKDETHYYMYNQKYPHADYESFIVLNSLFYKDKDRVYYRGEIIKEADPNTFEVFNLVKDNFHCSYAKDKNYIYYQHNIVNGADRISFTPENIGPSARDKKGKYYNGIRIE